ncbi:hypothetical protein [Pseudocolwellia agarivorans]|uniref:hypothetical protein n=1 Tax=Pseudocolwellia agarivorans TaxID=1911682 RepID=UPI000985D2F4|nr:hypothetical protein [Pseudocolwellia agarivorans]
MSPIEIAYTVSIFIISFGFIFIIKMAFSAIKKINTFWLTVTAQNKMTCFKFYQALYVSNVFDENAELQLVKRKLMKSLLFFVWLVVFIFAVRNGILQFVISPTGL